MTMRYATALLLGVLVAVAIGCGGSSGTIPASRTGAIKDHLDSVSAAIADERCSEIPGKVDALRSDITNLQSEGVPQELLRNLRAGVAQLSTAAATDCKAAATPTVSTATTETTPPVDTTTDETPTDTGDTGGPTPPTDTGDQGGTTTDQDTTSQPDTGGVTPPGPTGEAGPP